MGGMGVEGAGHGTNRELKICANLHVPDNLGTKPLTRFRRLRHNTARADVLAAAKAQPVDPLFVRETDAVQLFAHNAP